MEGSFETLRALRRCLLFKETGNMAKNTRSAAFRKIDVDEFNEDNYKDEEPAELQSPVLGPDEKEVIQLLNQGKAVEALKNCLRNAPVGSKSQQVKVK